MTRANVTDDLDSRSAPYVQGFIRSILNSAIGEALVQVMRVAGIVYLARHLQPADFGLYRMLLVVCSLAVLTAQAGMPETLVQRKMLRADHEAAAWWISLVVGLIIALALYIGASHMATLLTMPPLAAQVRLLVLPIFLMSISASGGARLNRLLNIGQLAFADAAAELSFFIVALALLLYFKVPEWSLAGGLAARMCVRAAVILICAGNTPRYLPTVHAAQELAPFALSVWTGSAVVSLSSNADYLLIGRNLGSAALGFYTIAWDLLRFIPDRLHKVIARVILPLFARIQDDNVELAQQYSTLVRETSRILLPLMSGLAIAAPEVIEALYGPRWANAAVPLRVLAVGLILGGVAVGTGPVYYAKGRPALDIYLHGLRLLLIAAVVTATSSKGLIAVSIGMSVVEGTIAISGQLIVDSIIDLNARRVFRALFPGIRNALLVAVSMEMGRLIVLETRLAGRFWGLLVIGALPAFTIGCIEMPRTIRFLKLAIRREQDAGSTLKDS